MMNSRRFHVLVLSVFTGVTLAGCNGATSTTHSSPSPVSSSSPNIQGSRDYAPPEIAGRIDSDDIKESSGLAVSKCQPNVLWTHNDQGSGPFIYALAGDGKHLGTWHIPNAENVDWEDIDEYKDANGKCFIYIGDIGDNDQVRPQLAIYRVPEPTVKPEDSASTKRNPLESEPAQVLMFTYGKAKHNAESLLVHPQTGDIYVLSKNNKKPSRIFKLKPGFGEPEIKLAEELGTISVPADPEGRLTGGSISPDGKRVILCDVQNGYELTLPPGETNFDAIWKQKPVVVDLGERKQGEGVSYNADGTAIYAGSERKNSPLFLIRRN